MDTKLLVLVLERESGLLVNKTNFGANLKRRALIFSEKYIFFLRNNINRNYPSLTDDAH